jgi:hypothetical protein
VSIKSYIAILLVITLRHSTTIHSTLSNIATIAHAIHPIANIAAIEIAAITSCATTNIPPNVTPMLSPTIVFLLLDIKNHSLINLTVSKRNKNRTHLNKNKGIKNNTHRTILIRTDLNKTELEKLLNNNTLAINETLISEIDEENENDTFADEFDIEIEDEIDDNGTMPHLVDFLVNKNDTSEAKSFLSINNRNYEKKSKIGIYLPLINLIILIYALIYLSKLEKNSKIVKTYKFFDLDSKQQSLIIKNE